MPTRTPLIGIDWGTSNCRGYLLGATGNVLDHVSDPRGIATVENNQFQLVLEDICGNWLAAHPNSPLLLSGMIGSRQGWIEAPYCPCPCALETIHQHAVALPSDRLTGYVVPGLIASGLSGAPDVMRGEETQIAGLAALQPGLTGTVCLPGSHSKWVSLRNNRIEGFSTFLTGELFGALCDHTLLGRLITNDPGSPHAFSRGLEQSTAAGGLLHQLFSARTRGLAGDLGGGDIASYLSGILIGSEIRAVAEQDYLEDTVHLIGGNDAAHRYHEALQSVGAKVTLWPGQEVTVAGLWLLGRQLGLCDDHPNE